MFLENNVFNMATQKVPFFNVYFVDVISEHIYTLKIHVTIYSLLAQSAGAAECTDCTSAEG